MIFEFNNWGCELCILGTNGGVNGNSFPPNLSRISHLCDVERYKREDVKIISMNLFIKRNLHVLSQTIITRLRQRCIFYDKLNFASVQTAIFLFTLVVVVVVFFDDVDGV